MIIGKLLKEYSPEKKYFILSDNDWEQYVVEMQEMFPLIKRQWEFWGYPMVSFRKPILHKHLKRGVPCVTYRGIPVFAEKYKDKVIKIFQ